MGSYKNFERNTRKRSLTRRESDRALPHVQNMRSVSASVQRLIEAGDYYTAEASLLPYLKGTRNDVLLTQAARIAFHGQGRASKALHYLDDALDLNPQNSYALSLRGDILQDLKPEEAAASFQLAARCTKDSAQIGIIQSKIACMQFKNNQPEQALDTITQCVKLDPNCAVAWSVQSRIFCALKRYEDALACSMRRLELDPRSAMGWGHHGKILGHLHRYEEMLEAEDKVLSLDPLNYWALQYKSIAFNALERHEEALEVIDKFFENYSSQDFILFQKSAALAGLGRHEDALTINNQILSASPDNIFYLNQKYGILLASHRSKEALKVANKMIATHPLDSRPWGHRCEALIAMGRYPEALEATKESIKLDPDKNYVAWCQQSKVLSALGRTCEAEIAIDEARKCGADERSCRNHTYRVFQAMDHPNDYTTGTIDWELQDAPIYKI